MTMVGRPSLKPTDTPVRQSKRAARFLHREFQWTQSALKRTKACGRNPIGDVTAIGVRVGDGVGHFTGLQTCGSIWACPVCGPKIRAERAGEIDAALSAHFALGGGVLFATFTVPHDCGDDLTHLLGVVSKSFSSLLAGKRWVQDRQTFGVVGTIRTLELTHGGAGWHPHLHVLILTERVLDDDELAVLTGVLHGRWCSAVVSRGLRRPHDEHGTRILRAEAGSAALGEYMSKVMDECGKTRPVALEMTRHDLKLGRRFGRNPMQILADAVATGDLDDLALWNEYEKRTKGRQCITWSKGLKARYAVGEATDEELADLEVGGEDVCSLSLLEWRTVRGNRGAAATVLDLAETAGAGAIRAYIASLPPPKRR